MNKNTFFLTVLALSLVLSIVSASHANAATYYVATTGNDANSCAMSTNINTPKRNIMGANGGISCLAAGDTLDIRAGTYNEYISWYTVPAPVTGTVSAPITIRGHTGETVQWKGAQFSAGGNIKYWVFDNLKIQADGSGMHAAFYFGSTNDHMTVKNSEIKYTECMGITGGAAFLTVQDTIIRDSGANCPGDGEPNGVPGHAHGVGYGIYWSGSDSLFERVDVYNNHGYGFHIYDSGSTIVSRNIVRYSKIHDNTGPEYGTAIIISHGDGNQVYDNLIYHNQFGIQFAASCTNCSVYNNVVYGSTIGGGIGIDATTGNVKNNIFYGNVGANNFSQSGTATVANNHCDSPVTGCGAGTGSSGNPLFVNAAGADFHLQSGSPAINAGVTLGSPYNVDKDGVSRPQGSAYDIGAYEYGGSPGTTPPPTTTCPNLLNSSLTVPTSFGASFNWFTNAKELLMNVVCSGTSATANIGNGSNTQYIYKTGYVWKNNQWTIFNYSGSSMDSGGNWFIGNANHSLGTLDLTKKQSVLSYICEWTPPTTGQASGKWNCGCHDSSCTTGYWNLQQFKQ